MGVDQYPYQVPERDSVIAQVSPDNFGYSVGSGFSGFFFPVCFQREKG